MNRTAAGAFKLGYIFRGTPSELISEFKYGHAVAVGRSYKKVLESLHGRNDHSLVVKSLLS